MDIYKDLPNAFRIINENPISMISPGYKYKLFISLSIPQLFNA